MPPSNQLIDGEEGSLPYRKLHTLRPRRPQFPADHHLTPLGSALHDEAEHAITGPSYSEAVEQFVSEGLALGYCRETPVLHFGGIERDAVFGELEALLDQGGEFADAAALLAQDFLGVGCADD